MHTTRRHPPRRSPTAARAGAVASSAALLALVVASLAGCAAPEPAPGDLDSLARFIWTRFETRAGDDAAVQDAELHDAVQKVHDAIDGDALPAPIKGTITDITVDELTVVGLEDRADKAALAQGMMIADVVPCSLEQIVASTLSTDQPTVHPGVYETYEKTFDTDPEAFRSGDVDTLSWNTTYSAKPVSVAYTAQVRAGARRVRALDGETTGPGGDLLVSRVYLPEPAVWESGDNTFDLDFQLEAYWRKSDTEVLHFYPLWRKMNLGIADSSSDLFITTSLDNMVKWDQQVADACANGTF